MPPRHDLSPVDGDDVPLRKDEYGDLFEDYGFLKRAEDYKKRGNEAFKRDLFEAALKEYDSALDQLVTVAFDKSITIGKRKWHDVVILRSTIHLNKSTCYFKLQQWQKSLQEAMECLIGNAREELMLADPQIRQRVLQAQQESGEIALTLLEKRLPRMTRAKAWFRASLCHANLLFLDRARETLQQAIENCDDEQLQVELSQHGTRIGLLERQQKQRQKRQFRGFWDKLQGGAGYAPAKDWDYLQYDERFREAEQEAAQDEVEEAAARLHIKPPEPQEISQEEVEAVQQAFARKVQETLPGKEVGKAIEELQRARSRSIDRSFEEYMARKAAQEGLGPDNFAQARSLSPGMPEVPPPAPELVPPRPRKKEEAPLKWAPGGRTRQAPRVASRSPARRHPAEAWASHYAEETKREQSWRQQFDDEGIDSEEELELQRARDRMALQRWERVSKEKRARLEALDDSD